MNLKRFVKYAGYIAVISCVALLSINLLSDNNILDKSNTAMINSIERDNFAEDLTNSNDAENKKSRIIVKPSENSNFPERDTTDNGNGTRAAVPSTNNNLKVQPLPPADANAQIIINLLQ